MDKNPQQSERSGGHDGQPKEHVTLRIPGLREWLEGLQRQGVNLKGGQLTIEDDGDPPTVDAGAGQASDRQ